jgi:transcriptional regulator with PAS, ATPase and Fis domain
MQRVSFYHKEVCHKLFKQGLRLGDQLELYPAVGRKKVISLNRTHYDIHSTKSLSHAQLGNCILALPEMSEHHYKIELSLVKSQNEKQLGTESRYLIRSLNGTPFRINGVFSFESFLERGDVLDFGYHKLKMNSSSSIYKNSAFVCESKKLNPRVVKSDISVLIEGETGTGKTRLANIIHNESGRSGRFVHLNLSSFSKNLIESELFGHKKGAFTGAVTDKCGAIEEAHYGTLFLDEIDSLSTELQTKLLLFLDNGLYRQVGGDGSKKSKVRVLFASGSSLKKLVESGEVRKDFYFRISNGVVVNLPPLRKSPELIRSICYDFALENKYYLSETLVEYYMSFKWPGNIRQLLSHLKKKIVLEGGDKLVWHECDEKLKLQDDEALDHDDLCDVISMESIKKNYAARVFKKYDGHLRNTAKALNLAPNTVRTMLKDIA